jgi:hypothetical protein
MKVVYFVGVALMLAIQAGAETYTWTDDNGTFNFTDDMSLVPQKYRKNVRKRGDVDVQAPVPVQKNEPASVTKRDVVPIAAEKNASPNGTLGGKTIAQWKQELGQSESAMQDLKKRIEDIDALLVKPGLGREKAQIMTDERNTLYTQFVEMRKQYDLMVGEARKAGITVELK